MAADLKAEAERVRSVEGIADRHAIAWRDFMGLAANCRQRAEKIERGEG